MRLLRRLFEIGKSTVFRYLDNGGPLLAAALAFHSLASIAPLALIAVSVAGLAFGEEAAAGRLNDQLRTYIGRDAAHAVNAMVSSLEDAQKSTHTTVIGTVLILFTGARLFSQMQDALNQLWRVRTSFANLRTGVWMTVYKKLVALAMVLGLGGLFTAFLISSTVASVLKNYLGDKLPGSNLLWQGVPVFITATLVTTLFATVYRWVPNARISWRDAWLGAGVGAVLFMAAEYPLSYYLTHGGITTVSGVAGSLVVFLFWIYYSAQIFFLGAQLSRVCADEAGRVPQPDDVAVMIKEVPVEPEDLMVSAAPRRSGRRPRRRKKRADGDPAPPSPPSAAR